MDDIEHQTENDRRPHTALERHLTVGTHLYQITAAGTGDERIDLTVLGWDAEGAVVSEVSGGISPDDLPAVAEALSSTLSGLAAVRRQRPKPVAPPGLARPRRHPNQGTRWTPEDDARLAARHREGVTARELMREFGRSRGGITARLEHLGLIASDGSPVPSAGSGAGPSAGVGVGEEAVAA
jgi:hypothetical protein